jgi:hypothetical protein
MYICHLFNDIVSAVEGMDIELFPLGFQLPCIIWMCHMSQCDKIIFVIEDWR